MKFVSRADWGARSPKSGLSPLDVSTVTVHWEGPHMGTPSHDECAGIVRGIQAYHMDVAPDGYIDIAYNALVCPHGYVFEGRGKGKRSGANGDYDANSASYAVCFIGGEGDTFTADAKNGINDAAEWLVAGARAWRVHRDWVSTSCPGDEIAGWVRSGHSRPNPPQEEDDMFTDQDRKLIDDINEVLNNTEVGVLRRVADNTRSLQSIERALAHIESELTAPKQA